MVELDDKIRKHNSEVKQLKNEKKEFESQILTYLENIGENVIDISDGKLKEMFQRQKLH